MRIEPDLLNRFKALKEINNEIEAFKIQIQNLTHSLEIAKLKQNELLEQLMVDLTIIFGEVKNEN